MQFVFRIVIIFVLLILIQYLFLRVISIAFKRTFPGMNIRIFREVRSILVILLNLYPLTLLIYSIITGGKTFPEGSLIDYSLIYPFWLYMLICIQALLFVLVEKIIKLLIYPFYRKRKEKYYPIEQRIIFILFIAALIYVPFRVIYDYNIVEITNVVYKKENLNPALKDFKLVFVSDTQADRYTNYKRLENYITLINKQNPDLVVMGGDVITSTPVYIDSAAFYLGKIKAKYGVFSCLGDHDHWAYRDNVQRSIQEVTAALSAKKVSMINNQDVKLNVNGAEVGLTFITNTYVERTSNKELKRLIAPGQKDLKILVTHQPGKDIIDMASSSNYDLFLAGHTHGGQITFLFPFMNLTPTLFETKYVRGKFRAGDMMIYINRGLGMSLIPMRLNSTPEITIFRFASK